MATTHYRSCNLCEAGCGIAVTVEGTEVKDIRGDEQDPFSKGYICPKASALADLHTDPDRLRRPVVRDEAAPGGWREVSWDAAIDLVTMKLRGIRRTYGKDAIAAYQGNPTAHNLGLMTYGQLLLRTLGTKNLYSATSLDQLPHMLAAHLMFGNQLLMAVPDIDRNELFICLGANPLASNGSIMTAPDMKSRLKAIRDRGGKVIVIDPRRTETAAKADHHYFLRPGTDAVLLLSMVHVIFESGRATLGRLEATGFRRAARRRGGVVAGARGGDHRHRGGCDSRPRHAARHHETRGALRAHGRLHAAIRRARGLAGLRDQRDHESPRRAGWADVHHTGDRSAARREARRVRRGFRALEVAGLRQAGVRRRAAGHVSRRGDRDGR